MVGYSPWGRKEQHDWTTSLSLSLWLSDSSIFPSLSNMLCVTDIFIFNINLWQRIWPTSWNIWNYHWGVKPGLDIIIHKWSCTYRSFPQCFGSEIELMLWWDAAAPAKSLQSCLTLCNPIEGSPPRLPRPWDLTFHPKTMNFNFFSSAHGNFSRIDHMLGHKSSLGKFLKNWNHSKHLFWTTMQ